MNICYYISSHGFGHAMRSFAIIKELLNYRVKIIIRADLPDWLVINSFKKNKVRYESGLKTCRVYHDPNLLTFQHNPTIQYLDNYWKNYNKIIENEVKFCEKNSIDLIISDIEPTAFEIANKCGIKSIAISNFTWHDIFSIIIPNETRIMRKLENAYGLASMIFRLPFHLEMPYFNEVIDVPLVVRKLTRTSQQIRSILEVTSSKKLIFIQFGGFTHTLLTRLTHKLYNYHVNNPEIKFLITSHSKFEINDFNNSMIKIIPADETEIQDYLVQSDLVVGKTGYSTVAEAVGYSVPFFYCTRELWKEDEGLVDGIETYGLGKQYSRQQIIEGDWIADILKGIQLKNTSPKKTIEKYGQDFIAKWIIKHC